MDGFDILGESDDGGEDEGLDSKLSANKEIPAKSVLDKRFPQPMSTRAATNLIHFVAQFMGIPGGGGATPAVSGTKVAINGK